MEDKELFDEIVRLLKQEVQDRRTHWVPMTDNMHRLFQEALQNHFNTIQ
jgi:hypothetical protein